MGKGSRPRPVDKKIYDANFERAFRKKKHKRESGVMDCPVENCKIPGYHDVTEHRAR